MKRVTLLLIGVLTLANDPSQAEMMARFENPQSPNRQGLDGYTLRQVMERFHVPGVSVAVIQGFEIHWAKGYGVADVESSAAVETNTLFQAASISKRVAAMAVVRAVQDGRFSLDDDINTILTSWKLPDSQYGPSRKSRKHEKRIRFVVSWFRNFVVSCSCDRVRTRRNLRPAPAVYDLTRAARQLDARRARERARADHAGDRIHGDDGKHARRRREVFRRGENADRRRPRVQQFGRRLWLDPSVSDVSDTSAQVIVSMLPVLLAARIAAVVAALALGLAILGLYSLVSYLVAERTHEIGLRMALGADSSDVMRLVLGQGVKLAILGPGCRHSHRRRRVPVAGQSALQRQRHRSGRVRCRVGSRAHGLDRRVLCSRATRDAARSADGAQAFVTTRHLQRSSNRSGTAVRILLRDAYGPNGSRTSDARPYAAWRHVRRSNLCRRGARRYLARMDRIRSVERPRADAPNRP